VSPAATAPFDAPALDYFSSHGIDPGVAAELGVGQEGGALVFPHGRRRNLSGGAKVIGTAGQGLTLWWPAGPPKAGAALICEGESDSLAAISAQRQIPPGDTGAAYFATVPVAAMPGTGFPVKRLADELATAGVKEAWLAFDGDEAGRRYTEKATAALTERGVRPLPIDLPDSRDLSDCIAAVADAGGWLADTLACADVANDEPARGEEAVQPVPDGAYAISAADVTPSRVEWLWPGRVPLSMLTLLVGDPGRGKSLLTCLLAGEVSRDGGTVLMATAEDALDAVVRPRLEAAQADLARVRFVQLRRDGVEEGIVLPDNIGELSELIERHDARLVIIDPLGAHLSGAVNAHRDQDVRRALAPLYRLAQEKGCAMVVVAHLNKAQGADPLQRVGGAHAITGAARSVLLLAPDPDDPEGERGSSRVLAQVKSSVGKEAPSLRYEIESIVLPGDAQIHTAALRYRGESEHDGRALLSTVDDETRSRAEEAEAFLVGELAAGAVPQKELFREARAAGIADKTLRRAKERLGVKSEKSGFEGGWVWVRSEGGQRPWPPSQPGDTGHLGADPPVERDAGVPEAAESEEHAHVPELATFAGEAPDTLTRR
jgi:hypothetical protein